MSLGQCLRCEAPVRVGGRGRPQRYCSTACKQAAYRARQLPVEMAAGRRWVRADGKRPITTSGAPASSTRSSTWSSLAEVRRSSAGDGFGVMLGSGLGCYDLDGFDQRDLPAFLASVPERVVYVERSVSGRGIHVFVEAEEGPGSRRAGVERYTRARFIRTTLDRIEV